MAANAKFKQLRTALALSMLVISGAATAATRPGLEEVRADLLRDGAETTVRRLWGTHQWDAVTAHMDRGEGAWIALAPGLAKGTDAATSESLTISLANALPRNPAAVLRVVDLGRDPPLAVSLVCGSPFIEPQQGFLPGYRREARAAVEGVPDPRLHAAQAACLSALRIH